MSNPFRDLFALLPAACGLVLALLLAGAPALAGDSIRIELRDGSSVSGELIRIGGGVAVVQSQSLGRVEVDIDEVQLMQRTGAKTSPGSGATPSPSRASDAERVVQRAQVDAVQGMIASDPEMLAAVAALSDDPLIAEILADEALMQQIQSGNYEALAKDPRLQRLSQHPTVKGLSRSVNGTR